MGGMGRGGGVGARSMGNLHKLYICVSGLLLRFEVAGTNVSIAGTEDGGRTAIFARTAKWEGGASRMHFGPFLGNLAFCFSSFK